MNTPEVKTEEMMSFVVQNMAPDMDEIRIRVSNSTDSVTVFVYRDEDGTVHVNVLDETEFTEYRNVLGRSGSTDRL
jgi:hypothetical protein